MFFATLWAFIMGKNAIDNGIKDAKLNSWSKKNTINPVTNTYIDAKGMTRDINSNAVVFMERTLDGHDIKKDIFGNVICDYTVEKSRADFLNAKANQDQFHTVVKRPNNIYQDLQDPTKEYIIQNLHVFDSIRMNTMDIPVYVDTQTALVVRPIDEYMEFISHNEFYKRIKKNYSFNFYIRDKAIINELIRQKNLTLTPGNMNANWGDVNGVCAWRVISTIEETKQSLIRTLEYDKKEKKENSVRRMLEKNNNVSFI